MSTLRYPWIHVGSRAGVRFGSRLWLLLLTGLLLVSEPGRAQAPLPIFDAHVHYSHDAWDVVPTAEVIALMRKAGLQGALVSSSNDDGTQKLLNAAPDLVIPSLRPYRTRGEISSWVRDDAVLAHVEQRLKKYRYAAFGEFHLYGADADLPNVRRMMQLAVQNNLILHAHSDIDAVERLVRQFPNAKILWAHSGFDRPAAVGAMLRKHKNLWADLAYRSDMGSNGKVDSEWAAVFTELPGRFMVGTDTFTPERLHYIPEHASFTRGWLSALPREVAERIAYRNAQELLRPVWTANRDKFSAVNGSLAGSGASAKASAGAAAGGASGAAAGATARSGAPGQSQDPKDTKDPCVTTDSAPPTVQSVSNSRVRVVFSPEPAPIRIGQPFSIHAQVCPASSAAQIQTFNVDATMPEHKHGMNYLPKVSPRGKGGFVADGLVFHMAGLWQLAFDLRIDGQDERLTQSVVVR